jgi:hypothetical protein
LANRDGRRLNPTAFGSDAAFAQVKLTSPARVLYGPPRLF